MTIDVEGYADIVEVARGGFGVVYKARHLQLNRTVAIKVLSQLHGDEHATRRWERECRAMGALSWHPNIVVVYDLGTTVEGDPFLAMEYLDRGSLADRLVNLGPLPWEEAVNMVIQVAGALQAAHDAGVLHRDLKPENVLLGLYGEAKLSDFGLATSENTVATAAGMASFTIAHASPEALRGERVGVPGDVYSLGSTLFHLLAGHPPFLRASDENVLAAVTRVINDPVPDLRGLGVPDQVASVVEAAMAKDPAARPATPADLGRALQDAQRSLGVPVTEMRLDPRGEVSGPTVAGVVLPDVPDPGEDSGTTVQVATDAGEPASGAPAAPPAAPVVPPSPAPPPPTPPAPPPPDAPPPPAPAAPPPVDAPPPAAAPAASTPSEPPAPAAAPAKRSKVPLVVGAVVVVALLVVGAVVLLGGGGGDGDGGDGGGAAGSGDDGGAVDAGATGGEVVASISVGRTPRGVAVDDDAAWVANRDDATVSRIDTGDDKVSDTVDVGEGPRDVAVGLGSVWVTSFEAQEVARLDPADGTVRDTVTFDGGPQAVTTAGGLVWVTDRADSSVEAIDPETLDTVDEITVGADPSAIVADGDAFVWVTNRDDGTLSKIDVEAREVVGTFEVGDLPAEAAVDGSSVWLASEGTSSVLRLDKETGEVLATVDVGQRVEGVALDDAGRPWVDGLSQLFEIDPEDASVVGEVEVGGELREVAAGAGSLWTVPHDGNILTRVDPN